MIIESSDNRLFDVCEHHDPKLAHCWLGIEVKRTPKGPLPFAPKAKATLQLVRKAAARVVEA